MKKMKKSIVGKIWIGKLKNGMMEIRVEFMELRLKIIKEMELKWKKNGELGNLKELGKRFKVGIGLKRIGRNGIEREKKIVRKRKNVKRKIGDGVRERIMKVEMGEIEKILNLRGKEKNMVFKLSIVRLK